MKSREKIKLFSYLYHTRIITTTNQVEHFPTRIYHLFIHLFLSFLNFVSILFSKHHFILFLIFLSCGWRESLYFCSAAPTAAPSRQPTSQPTFQIVDPAIRDRLVGYYPCKSNVLDYSGNQYDGTAHGITYNTDRFGIGSNACAFDGSTSYIELPASPYNFRSNVTIAYWIRASSPQPSYFSLFDKSHYNQASNYAASGWCIMQSASSTNNLGFNYIQPANTQNFNNIFSVSSSTWTHIAYVKSRGYTTSYKNGVFQQRSFHSSNYIMIPNNNPLIIGATNFGTTNPAISLGSFFTGRLQEIFIYNRTLTASEILSLYTLETPTSQPSTQPSGKTSIAIFLLVSDRVSLFVGSPTGSPTSQPSRRPTGQPICK